MNDTELKSVPQPSRAVIEADVDRALEEDVGKGDLTADLVPESRMAQGSIIAREAAVICGRPWVEEVFRRLDKSIGTRWEVAEGEWIEPGGVVCRLHGPTRALLTGERTALNFLQFLSGTATTARLFADAVAGTPTQILDTRKTIPGLRYAQKYATRCGGVVNHRFGLFDAYLIKENHIIACGGLTPAVELARIRAAGAPVTVEIENLEQLEAAIAAGADVVMLDNFDFADLPATVEQAAGRVQLEVSGGVDLEQVRRLANTGVDRISVGAITKHLHAVDLSMRLTTERGNAGGRLSE
ncbi:quinolinate phosphoribosyltransferase [decarboxylating] [Halorhodospira halochloris]|uniref:Probable nicotinate-nucleotide pyrophosphorylase [carboxylating] n=1 Tax=Halorhodospira halochloris TaxID=1052 RepID=A0A120N015_HALHR|nr:carboxylating nicotinate-nucleotide diphosphorylase [Halorhodospira halochloris]MBK1651602.1 nicotinate-nucleotide diphosphorylase (carboxylating) [Halorhodospira halochloris]BAU58463.1 quinolinate phosphoribosyltransferase [decarboxylating] [Halorhodospira halochloris]